MSVSKKVSLNVLDLGKVSRGLEKLWQGMPRTIPLTQSTYCPRLWSDVFVNDHGDVYYCCHEQPFSIGNLHKATLRELWNGFRAQQARRLALTRTLYCYDRCRLLDDAERATRPGPDASVQVPYEGLKRIKILVGQLCNIQCIMCNQDHRSKLQLNADTLRSQIDFTHIDDIEFQGGEPMAMDGSKEAYIWLTEEMGKKVNFLTNGTIMPEDWAERICRGSQWIYFSINGVQPETFERVNAGAKFDRVIRNLERVKAARARLGSSLEIVAHFTIVPDNILEVDQFPTLGKQLGVNRVDFGYDLGSIPRWLDRNPAERERIRKSFDAQLAQPEIEIRSHRLRMLGLASS